MWFSIYFVPAWPLVCGSVAIAIFIALTLRQNWRDSFQEPSMSRRPQLRYSFPSKPTPPSVMYEYEYEDGGRRGFGAELTVVIAALVILAGFLALCFSTSFHPRGIQVPPVTVSDLMGRMATSPYDRANTGYIVDGHPVDVVLDRTAHTITITVLPEAK